MHINYDPEADALYIQLREGEVDDTLEAGGHVYIDVDADGVPLGVELLFAGRLLDQEEMTSVTVNIGRMAQTRTEVAVPPSGLSEKEFGSF